MAIFDLFSKRQADAAKSGTDDVYQYNEIPTNLRVQVKQIALEGIGLVGSQGDGIMSGDGIHCGNLLATVRPSTTEALRSAFLPRGRLH